MLLDILRQFKWTDILVIILLFRACYVALKNGLPVEFFKFLGTILAIYLAMHYFTALADLIEAKLSLKVMPLEFLDFLCFVLLAIIGYLVFVILRGVFNRFIKMEAAPRLNKWGGLLFGILRGILWVSLVLFLFFISTVGYLRKSVQESYFGRRLVRVVPETYSGLWNTLMSKFMAGEKFNKTVLEIEQEINQ